VVHDAGVIELLESLLGENAVVGDGLDLQEATVGRKADLPKSRQVPQAFPDIEILGVVDRRLGAQRLAFFVVLLDAGALVVDVQGWNDAIGDDTGPETAGCGFGHSAVEDELYLFGAADVQVFADHILEEDPATDGTIQHLGQGQFDLEDGDLVSVSGLPIPGPERGAATGAAIFATGRRSSRPTRNRRYSGGAWGRRRIGCRCPKRDTSGTIQLAFGVFVAVQAELGVVGEVGAELQEEGGRNSRPRSRSNNCRPRRWI